MLKASVNLKSREVGEVYHYTHLPHDCGIELGQRDNEKEVEKLPLLMA